MDLEKILADSKTLSDLSMKIFGNKNYTNREKCKKILKENGIDWEEWLAEKKIKPKKYCLQCGKEIFGNKKFCNHSCAASYNNKGVVRNGEKRNNECLYCGKKLKTFQRNFCCHEHYNLYKEKEYIEKWKSGEKSGLRGKYDIAIPVRKYIFQKNNNKCERCGKEFVNPYTNKSILQIHHIDGDCTNNTEENLRLLCPNCHAMTENFGSRNKKATRKDNRKRY